MYASLAQLGLVFSILLAILVPCGMIWLKPLSISRFRRLLDNIILLQFIAICFAFIALSYAYLSSDLSLLNVFNNSHLAIPLIYKFSGLWSNHEGSMILWLFFLSLANLITIQHRLPNQERIWVAATQIIITASLIAYTLLASNPFIRLDYAPLQGEGFNPLLQDIGLAIHPPILYIGYVTTLIGFAISIAALVNHKLSPALLEIMQKWTLFSWSFLTLGVALGSWWAYRELGWGGYWFWDPVENASLLPWLTSSALIHSIYATKKLATNYKWTILLALTTFLLSILATFLVRSGIVTSVHSFANDPNRGSFILALLVLYSGTALGLFAFKGHHLTSSQSPNWLSRFGGINIGNIFWVIAAFTILLSLLYPLAMEFYLGEQITVNRQFFEKSFIPLLLIILLIMAFALPTSWQNILPLHYRHFAYSFLIALIISLNFYYFTIQKSSLISLFAFFIGSLVVSRMSFWFIQRLSTKMTIKFYLIWLVHIAAGLLAMNIAFLETQSQETLITMQEGDQVKFADFEIYYAKRENQAIDNYLVGKVILHVDHHIVLEPEIRYYPIEKTQTSEASIYHHTCYDLYAVISEISKTGDVSIKLYFKPLISWLWLLCGIIFTCGVALLVHQCRHKLPKS